MSSVLGFLVFSLFVEELLSVFFIGISLLTFFFLYFFSPLGLYSELSPWCSMDSVNFLFVLLSFILILLTLSLGLYSNFYNPILFTGLCFGLLLSLILFFSSWTLVRLYVFFEFSFVFVMLMILNWGINPERIQALVYFLLYSFVGSLPLFLFVFSVARVMPSSSIFLVKFWDSCNSFVLDETYAVTYLAFFALIAFLIKVPVFGLHIWLPKAHLEAPVFGSMLLAGLMLKIGVFGILQFMHLYSLIEFDLISAGIGYFLFSLILINLICTRQFDLKAYVAYSSIVHMTLILIGIWVGSFYSVVSGTLLSFAHGMCSSGLFLSVNSIYSSTKTRNVLMNRGLLYLWPLFIFLWFILCACNCSIPPSLSFISEICLILNSILHVPSSVLFFMSNVFFCGLYCMFLYLLVSHGKLSISLHFLKSSSSLQSIFTNILIHSSLVLLALTLAEVLNVL